MKLRSRSYLTEGHRVNWIWAFSRRPDVEFALIPMNDFFDVQVGMGGEWWNGRVKGGVNTLHHKKEKVDEGYQPVKVIVDYGKDRVSFAVSGGFAGGDTAIFYFRLVANT